MSPTTNGFESHHISLDKFLKGVTNEELQRILTVVHRRDPDQSEFLDSVHEVALSLQPLFDDKTVDPGIVAQFERLCEPERTVMFSVPWLDDKNNLRVNRGMRTQFNSAIGPCKGGLRFHPSVRLSIIKMLGFEQTFKNALTGLPLGAGKGGSDFDPKGKSDGEIQRFCQSFMTELVKYIDQETDVPAGDIGVGTREIGYLFGQFKRITGKFQPGVLTGKGVGWGGSWGRPEATGYGAVYIAEEILLDSQDSLKGKRCLVSGAGNVALFCAKKLVADGAVVLTVSDSGGTLICKDGFTAEQVEALMQLKSDHNGRLSEFNDPSTVYLGDGAKPWTADVGGSVDIAFPSATQNELDANDAKVLVGKGCKLVVEGANMPCTLDAADVLLANGALFVPGKMANAGGVAVSGLEMLQNKAMLTFEAEDVLHRLQAIMQDIYKQAKHYAKVYNCDLGSGANIAAFLKVAGAMKAQGAV